MEPPRQSFIVRRGTLIAFKGTCYALVQKSFGKTRLTVSLRRTRIHRCKYARGCLFNQEPYAPVPKVRFCLDLSYPYRIPCPHLGQLRYGVRNVNFIDESQQPPLAWTNVEISSRLQYFFGVVFSDSSGICNVHAERGTTAGIRGIMEIPRHHALHLWRGILVCFVRSCAPFTDRINRAAREDFRAGWVSAGCQKRKSAHAAGNRVPREWFNLVNSVHRCSASR